MRPTFILADIDKWVHDFSDDSQSFLWLTGAPGSGKSTIARCVEQECRRVGILWAHIFINRFLDPKRYFPLIARQLADHIPDSDVAIAIHDAIRENPLFVDGISMDQALRLFLNPIEIASKQHPKKPVVVVIDGLDETSGQDLKSMVAIFCMLFAMLRCVNVKVFISSRDDVFEPFHKAENVKHINIDRYYQSGDMQEVISEFI
jgi:Cdc6-like AAA superfamily ATPase